MDTLETLKQHGEAFTYEGRAIPRLTAIMQALGIVDYGDIPGVAREFYLDRGRKAHKATELWDRGLLREETLDPVLVGYLEGWKNAVLDLNLNFTHIEDRMVNEVYWYTCQLDRRGTWDGVPAIVEIKSGKIEWWTGMQLAGQAACVPDGQEYKRLGIELPGDGTYKAYPFTDKTDRPLILSAVSLYHRKQNKK
jgi:hypothetical protein